MTRGLMASGKSTLSRALGAELGWPVIDKDDINDVLIGKVENPGPLAYEAMFSVADGLLSQGFSVICDSPLRGLEGYHHAAELATRHHAEVRLITCICSDDALWRERLTSKQRRPAQQVRDWTTFLAYRAQVQLEPPPAQTFPAPEVDTAAPLEQNVERVRGWLQARNRIQSKEISS